MAGLTNVRKVRDLSRGFLDRREVRVVGVVALLVVVVVVLFLVLDWYVTPTTPGERKDLVLAVAQILGGTALLLGLYFTWRTLRVNREGQITERFTRAIDQLGKIEDGKKLFEIRIGGIYALERIAKESEEDYWPIMEVLTAYVRQNAPRPTEVGKEDTDDATEAQSNMEGSRVKSETLELPDQNIQAITNVLRRRKHYYMRGEPERLDLRVTNLSGVDLREAFLYGADLSGAFLYRVDLSGARLPGADLSGAQHLTKEQLEQAEGDENTQLPPHLKPPAHWGVKTDEEPEED